MKLKDPYAKKGLPTWKKLLVTVVVLGAAFVALWLTNCLAWAKLPSPLSCYNKVETEQVTETQAESAAPESQEAAPAVPAESAATAENPAPAA